MALHDLPNRQTKRSCNDRARSPGGTTSPTFRERLPLLRRRKTTLARRASGVEGVVWADFGACPLRPEEKLAERRVKVYRALQRPAEQAHSQSTLPEPN